MKLKIALSGYGRMGKEVEKAALARGHSIILKADNIYDWENTGELLPQCDVVIDFSMPASAPDVVKMCFKHAIPVVSGTTGWNRELEPLRQLCIDERKTFFYAPNFSIGVNIFFEINSKLSELLSNHKDYYPHIHEIHHIKKIDAPSGTAIALANDINVHHSVYQSGWTDQPGAENEKVLITSERTGEIPGTHIVEWASATDNIEIRHTAHSRQGFATGAVIAAEWVIGKKGYFGMRDMLKIN
ncbi:MAG: 4-hydroxy-tetrahydrodipicolinate reductase [Lentimicrobium sp.]|nr:4-hydroxy-tetrahydrodipicolinate reductase [Lentimicrobium sp.]